LLERIEAAQKEGLKSGPTLYTYTAAGTDSTLACRLGRRMAVTRQLFKSDCANPATREKIVAEVRIDSDAWENLYLALGRRMKILLVVLNLKNSSRSPANRSPK